MNGQRVILLQDALQLMNQTDRNGLPIPFSVEFVTHNDAGVECGRIKSIEKATMVSIIRGKVVKNNSLRNPNHWKNATRNIKEAGLERIYKVHIWLITKVNGCTVKWFMHG
jgi:hypothetical protein